MVWNIRNAGMSCFHSNHISSVLLHPQAPNATDDPSPRRFLHAPLRIQRHLQGGRSKRGVKASTGVDKRQRQILFRGVNLPESRLLAPTIRGVLEPWFTKEASPPTISSPGSQRRYIWIRLLSILIFNTFISHYLVGGIHTRGF